jgi:hypothetical protein
MTLHLYGKREKEIGEGKKGGLGWIKWMRYIHFYTSFINF